MKLYMKHLLLTSKGFANAAIEEAFLSLLPTAPHDLKVAIIPTASQVMKERHPHIIAAGAHLLQMGFQTVDSIDVENEDAALLHAYDVFYFSGGNPFYLLYQLNISGADEIIRQKAAEGTVIMGVSAGAVVLGPHIELVQYLTPKMRVGIELTNLTALGLFTFPLLPHYDREDVFPSESSIEQRLQAFENRLQTSVQRLRDDEALLLRGDKIVRISQQRTI